MIRAQRRTHRQVWRLLLPTLLLVGAYAVASRPTYPPQAPVVIDGASTPSEEGAER